MRVGGGVTRRECSGCTRRGLARSCVSFGVYTSTTSPHFLTHLDPPHASLPRTPHKLSPPTHTRARTRHTHTHTRTHTHTAHMLRAALAAAGAVARRSTARASSDCGGLRAAPALFTQTRGKAWSIEAETGHTYKDPAAIIDGAAIARAIDNGRAHARDPAAVAAVLAAASDRAFLKTAEPGPSEFVQGLTLDEAGILLGVDAHDADAMAPIYATALAIKQRIYANRIVLFAPLYIANYCVNSCRYCAFRCENKEIERSVLTHDQIRAEVAALERAGHRRLLVLTGEHPRYTFDQFLEALHVIAGVRTEPCGEIRRMNVEIPSLSVSDMRRLKATNHVGTYTLFQETYHRETFKVSWKGRRKRRVSPRAPCFGFNPPRRSRHPPTTTTTHPPSACTCAAPNQTTTTASSPTTAPCGAAWTTSASAPCSASPPMNTKCWA